MAHTPWLASFVAPQERVSATVERTLPPDGGGQPVHPICAKTRLRVLQGAVGAFWASTGPGVPSMFDSLEVKVLCPGLVRQRASEAQGRFPRGAV